MGRRHVYKNRLWVTRSVRSVLLGLTLTLTSPAATSSAGEDRLETVRGHLMPFKCQHDDKLSHTRECALRPECMATGYGLTLADGTFVQFDLESSQKAVRTLTRSTKPNDLVAEAEGYRTGPLFHVRTLRLK
jgi:hypothetical protein